MKPLTEREMLLFQKALFYRARLNHCNPDVGMGPTIRMLAEQVVLSLPFDIKSDDLDIACEEVESQL